MYVRNLAVLVLLAMGWAAAVEDDNLFYGWANEKDDFVADMIASRLAGAPFAGVDPAINIAAGIPTPSFGPIGGPFVVAPPMTFAAPVAAAPAPAAAPTAAPAPAAPQVTAAQAAAQSQQAIDQANAAKAAAIAKIEADKAAQIAKAEAEAKAKAVAEAQKKAQDEAAAKAAQAAEEAAKAKAQADAQATTGIEAEFDAASIRAKALAAQLAEANSAIQRAYDEADITHSAAVTALKAHEEAEAQARLARRAAKEAERQEKRKITDAAVKQAHEDAVKAIEKELTDKKNGAEAQFGDAARNSKTELDALRTKIENLRENILKKKAEEAAAAKIALEKKLEDAKASVNKFQSELEQLHSRKNGSTVAAAPAAQPAPAVVAAAPAVVVAAPHAHAHVIIAGGEQLAITNGQRVRVIGDVIGAPAAAAAAAEPTNAHFFTPSGHVIPASINGQAVNTEAKLAALATAIDPEEGLKVAKDARATSSKRAAKLRKAAEKLRKAHNDAKQIALDQFKAELKAQKAQLKAQKAQQEFLQARSEEAGVHTAIRAQTNRMVAKKIVEHVQKVQQIQAQIPAAVAAAAANAAGQFQFGEPVYFN